MLANLNFEILVKRFHGIELLLSFIDQGIVETWSLSSSLLFHCGRCFCFLNRPLAFRAFAAFL